MNVSYRVYIDKRAIRMRIHNYRNLIFGFGGSNNSFFGADCVSDYFCYNMVGASSNSYLDCNFSL